MERLLKIKELKKIECYFIPSDYIHKLSNLNVAIKFKNDYSFDSDFVLYNDFNNLKEIYYKKSINFYSKKEINNNFEYFLKINRLIKVINLYYYSKEAVEYILSKLDENGIKGIKILIHLNEDNNSLINKDINYLKKLNKNDNNEIKIIYSDDFFSSRIFKALTYNGVKLVLIAMLYLGVLLMFSSVYHEYKAALEMRKLEEDLSTISLEEEHIEVDQINDESEEEANENTDDVFIDPYTNIPNTFDKLLSINSDVVGWLSVNNTRVNYPVLQSKDNDYDLTHDIYGNYMISGWVFMDFRVNKESLNKNTIIYGHNMRSGLMFGTLYYASYYNWYTNPVNQIITFNTLNENAEYKIFSIYKVDDTNDYLRVNFNGDEDFASFVNMIKSRSIYDFGVEVTSEDNILTLSTCSGNNRRLVIHAVKIK